MIRFGMLNAFYYQAWKVFMLPCELVIKLTQHMNREYCSAGIYIASSSWFFEHELIEAAQASRALAQNSVTRLMKFYDFLSNYQEIPFINQDISSPCETVLSLEGIIDEVLSDYRIRNECILEIENAVRTTSNIKTQLFLAKMKSFYRDEAHLLLNLIKGDFLSKNQSERCRL